MLNFWGCKSKKSFFFTPVKPIYFSAIYIRGYFIPCHNWAWGRPPCTAPPPFTEGASGNLNPWDQCIGKCTSQSHGMDAAWVLYCSILLLKHDRFSIAMLVSPNMIVATTKPPWWTMKSWLVQLGSLGWHFMAFYYPWTIGYCILPETKMELEKRPFGKGNLSTNHQFVGFHVSF